MKPEIKKLWIEALRSGKFKQGQGWLRQRFSSGYRHCCLGVLCEVFNAETGQGEWKESSTTWLPFKVGDSESAAVVPAPVVEWAGLTDANPRLGRTKHAAALNDTGRDFDYIADRIEKYL